MSLETNGHKSRLLLRQTASKREGKDVRLFAHTPQPSIPASGRRRERLQTNPDKDALGWKMMPSRIGEQFDYTAVAVE